MTYTRWALGGVGILMFFAAGASESRSPSPQRGDIVGDAEFDALLSSAAQRALNRLSGKPELRLPATAMAQFDLETGTIIVNLSGGALPETGGAQLEDIQGYLMNDVLDEARPIHPASGVEFRYNGRRFEEQYPRDALSVAPRLPRNAITGPVVVSAGHGWYFHHGYKDWRAQREPSHGIVEDEITLDYADELRSWLISRSAVEVNPVRSRATDVHVPSMQAWR